MESEQDGSLESQRTLVMVVLTLKSTLLNILWTWDARRR
jgi:hypothetical protein